MKKDCIGHLIQNMGGGGSDDDSIVGVQFRK
jgi:hypothetical protein